MIPHQKRFMDTPAAPQDHWSFSTHGPLILFFVLIAFSVVALCASAALRKRRIQSGECRTVRAEETVSMPGDVNTRCEVIKQVMACSLQWSKENEGVEMVETVAESAEKVRWEGSGGMTTTTVASTITTPPLWQRRILMGERCELPRFSGLILYDEHGRPLHRNDFTATAIPESPFAPVTTLKDLL